MEYCISDDLKKTLKALREYVNVEYKGKNSTVVLAAPSYGDPEYLRVYMNGGNIGKISLVPGKLSTGISGAYSHKCTETVPNCVKELRAKKTSEKRRLEILRSIEYLQYASEATHAYASKDNSHTDKERYVETCMMNYHNQKKFNAAIDMEMQYSITGHLGWVKEKEPNIDYCKETKRAHGVVYYNSDPEAIKSPRVDLMIINEEGIGFVELKVDNESCQNLSKHIEDMNYILKHKEVFIEDSLRRIESLEKLELLESQVANNIEHFRKDRKLWCGILFVGNTDNHFEDAKEMIRKIKLKKHKINDDIRFRFIDKTEIDNNNMNLGKKTFIHIDEFLQQKI